MSEPQKVKNRRRDEDLFLHEFQYELVDDRQQHLGGTPTIKSGGLIAVPAVEPGGQSAEYTTGLLRLTPDERVMQALEAVLVACGRAKPRTTAKLSPPPRHNCSAWNI